jgi:cytoskeletal protein RodZ
MRKFPRPRVSPALVISIVALVLALGDTSMASVPVGYLSRALGLSSREQKQVKSIAEKEIAIKAPGLSVRSAATAGDATTAKTATSATNATNANSATTATNATNATNAVNASQAANAVNATTASNADHADSSAQLDAVTLAREAVMIPPETTFWTWAKCPAGDVPISGGVYNTQPHAVVVASDPWSTSTGAGPGGAPEEWFGASENPETVGETETVWAICVKAGSVTGF